MNRDLDFSSVIGSIGQDMKESLGMLLSALDGLRDELAPAQPSSRLNTLQYEAQRIQSDLTQLLGLYRLQQQTSPAHVEEQFLPAFLEEQLSQHQALAAARGLTLRVDAAPVVGYFDHELISGVLNTVINNAIRYTHTALCVSAREQDGYVLLTVADDGQGYPEHMRRPLNMLNPQRTDCADVESVMGTSSLGLYFAACVARMHQAPGRRGQIKLSNGGELGGGIFELWLP